MSNIDLLHKIDLAMLEEVVEICNRHNLKYYMLGGTMLGAVRYQGFIPWDDDVDLGMPRDDYEKFLSIAPSELSPFLKVVNYRNTPSYQYYITRILNLNTKVEEFRIGNDSRFTSVFIDIFPIDGTPNNYFCRKLYFFRVLYHRALMSLCYKDSIDRNRKRHFIEKIFLAIVEKLPIEKLTTPYKQKCIIDKLLRTQKVDGSKYIGNIMGAYRTREIVPASYYGKGKMYQFEHLQLNGLEDYDGYLTYTYGKYMEIPSLEKRTQHFKLLEVNSKKIIE